LVKILYFKEIFLMDFKTNIARSISKIVDIDENEIIEFIEIPSDVNMGDFAFPCFKLAKKLKKSPAAIAQDICADIGNVEGISDIKAVNGYINFFVDRLVFVKEVLNEVFSKKNDYGKSNYGQEKNIVIDYSSPNVAKPFHVGHLRSTVIGNALYNIFNCIGFKSIGINHLGDWGTQFGKLIVAYKNWGNKEAVEKDDVKELSRIYVKFHEEAEKNTDLDDEARGWLVKMQEGDKEALDLWKWFVEISMKEFERIYKRLNIKFDYYTGESFYNDKMAAVVDEIREKGLLVESEGARVVDLEEYNMPPCLILRRDGGTLYPTRDISAAIYRKKTYDFDKCLYITALDQKLHFAQWFKVLELMGYKWSSDLVHIPFGLVSLGDGKLSTRKGHVVLMEDILNSAVEKTNSIINEKNPNLNDKKQIAEDVGIGAVIFNDLYNSRIKNVVFDLQKMLNFDGETGPYVQYTHARAASVLRKANVSEENLSFDIDFKTLTDDASVEVCRALSQYPQKIIDAAEKYEPYIITRHIVYLCQAFNRFYHDNSILGSDNETKKARIALTFAVKTVIHSGLELLGIKAPDEM